MQTVICNRRNLGQVLLGLSLTVMLCACSGEQPRPTLEEAEEFIDEAESRLLELWLDSQRATWVQNNFITTDSNTIAAMANERVMAATTDLAARAVRFNVLDLPDEHHRKLTLLKTSLAEVAPSTTGMQGELARLMTHMETIYGQGEYCPKGQEDCLDLQTMERMFAKLRETDELLAIWTGWRKVSSDIRPLYERFVELSNAGAKELGFADTGEMWRSAYDMPPDDFASELERLWQQVKPLYESLHCHIRAKLAEEYGTAVVPESEPIPAHLLGNIWGHKWSNVYDAYDSIGPRHGGPGYDLNRLLERGGVDEVEMVRYGERFFTSLGFDPLPSTFWDRSLFVKPNDRDVDCHPTAWDIDYESDIRIKMCIEVNEEDFITIHHELGHNYYQRAYSVQDPLHRSGANDGFHEGIGDTIGLSITPDYLVEVGLLREVSSTGNDIGLLLRQALDKVAFLPFGLLIDQWRWKVFSGEISPDKYTTAWWQLRHEYQGIRPPVPRSEESFDPGANYHVPANTPYTRYFLAHILQFQFHRALCEAAGFDGPLHRCSIYGSFEAGERLTTMLKMGASRPWPDALETITGTREMDSSALLDYFAPLSAWLDEQNQARTCGW